MATKVNGSVGDNSSKYDYYLEYDTSFDITTMEWTVTVTAYLVVKKTKYQGKTTYNVSIGGEIVDSLQSTTLTRGDNKTEIKYVMGTGSNTYAASDKDRTISVWTAMNAPSGGWGPAYCSASTSVVLPAKYRTSGKLTANNISSAGCSFYVTELPKDLGYDKECYFYYRVLGTSAWTRFSHVTVPDNETTCETFVTGLIPEETYEISCDVYSPNPPDKMLFYLTTTVTLPVAGLTLSLSEIDSRSAEIHLYDVEQVVPVHRTFHGYCKPSDSSEWVLRSIIDLDANVEAGIFGMNFNDLTSGTSYDFKVEIYYNEVLTVEAALSATTTVLVDYSILNSYISDNNLVIECMDNKNQDFIGQASVYIRDENMPYFFVGGQSVDFTEDSRVEINLPIPATIPIDYLTGTTSVKAIFHTGEEVKKIFQLTPTHN